MRALLHTFCRLRKVPKGQQPSTCQFGKSNSVSQLRLCRFFHSIRNVLLQHLLHVGACWHPRNNCRAWRKLPICRSGRSMLCQPRANVQVFRLYLCWRGRNTLATNHHRLQSAKGHNDQSPIFAIRRRKVQLHLCAKFARCRVC